MDRLVGDRRTGGKQVGGCPAYLLGVPFCVGQLGGHVKHDLLVAEVAVHRLGPRLPVGHVQASTESAPGPQATVQSAAPARPPRGQDRGYPPVQDYSLLIPPQCSPLKVLQFDLLAKKFEELHKGRAFLVGTEELLLGGLGHRGQRAWSCSSWPPLPHTPEKAGRRTSGSPGETESLAKV